MHDSEMVRIDFTGHVAGRAHKTQGTRVYVGGTQVKGITGITLRADPNNVWRATIECIPSLPDHIVAEYVQPDTSEPSHPPVNA